MKTNKDSSAPLTVDTEADALAALLRVASVLREISENEPGDEDGTDKD